MLLEAWLYCAVICKGAWPCCVAEMWYFLSSVSGANKALVLFVALLPLFMSCFLSSVAKTLLRTLQLRGSALLWNNYMPIPLHCILAQIFWSSLPEQGWWDDTKQLDQDAVWGQRQLAFLWERQTIGNWVSKKRVLETKLYSICGGEKQNSDSVSAARIFQNKQTRARSKARLAAMGTCGFSSLRLGLWVDLLLPECSGEFGLSLLRFSRNVVSLDGAISCPGACKDPW